MHWISLSFKISRAPDAKIERVRIQLENISSYYVEDNRTVVSMVNQGHLYVKETPEEIDRLIGVAMGASEK